jgi:hypothetical protein
MMVSSQLHIPAALPPVVGSPVSIEQKLVIWTIWKRRRRKTKKKKTKKHPAILDFKLLPCSECCMLFLLGYSPASEFYMPTFRNTLSVPSSWADTYRMTMFKKCFLNMVLLHLSAYEDATLYLFHLHRQIHIELLCLRNVS